MDDGEPLECPADQVGLFTAYAQSTLRHTLWATFYAFLTAQLSSTYSWTNVRPHVGPSPANEPSRKSYNILLRIRKKKQKKRKYIDALRYSRLKLLPRSVRCRLHVTAAAAAREESGRGMRGTTCGAQRCIQQQSQRAAHQMRSDLLDEATRIEASRTVPAA